MTLCLVTDRRRVCSDASDVLLACRCLAEQVRHAVDAGIDLVQVRERDLTTADLADLVSDLVRLRRGTRTRIVVNDRVDVAVACGPTARISEATRCPPMPTHRSARISVGRSKQRQRSQDVRPRRLPDRRHDIRDGVEARSRAARWKAWRASLSPVPVLAIGGVSIDRGQRSPQRARPGRCYRLVHWFRCRGWGSCRGAAWDARRRDSSTV